MVVLLILRRIPFFGIFTTKNPQVNCNFSLTADGLYVRCVTLTCYEQVGSWTLILRFVESRVVTQ